MEIDEINLKVNSSNSMKDEKSNEKDNFNGFDDSRAKFNIIKKSESVPSNINIIHNNKDNGFDLLINEKKGVKTNESIINKVLEEKDAFNPNDEEIEKVVFCDKTLNKNSFYVGNLLNSENSFENINDYPISSSSASKLLEPLNEDNILKVRNKIEKRNFISFIDTDKMEKEYYLFNSPSRKYLKYLDEKIGKNPTGFDYGDIIPFKNSMNKFELDIESKDNYYETSIPLQLNIPELATPVPSLTSNNTSFVLSKRVANLNIDSHTVSLSSDEKSIISFPKSNMYKISGKGKYSRKFPFRKKLNISGISLNKSDLDMDECILPFNYHPVWEKTPEDILFEENEKKKNISLEENRKIMEIETAMELGKKVKHDEKNKSFDYDPLELEDEIGENNNDIMMIFEERRKFLEEHKIDIEILNSFKFSYESTKPKQGFKDNEDNVMIQSIKSPKTKLADFLVANSEDSQLKNNEISGNDVIDNSMSGSLRISKSPSVKSLVTPSSTSPSVSMQSSSSLFPLAFSSSVSSKLTEKNESHTMNSLIPSFSKSSLADHENYDYDDDSYKPSSSSERGLKPSVSSSFSSYDKSSNKISHNLKTPLYRRKGFYSLNSSIFNTNSVRKINSSSGNLPFLISVGSTSTYTSSSTTCSSLPFTSPFLQRLLYGHGNSLASFLLSPLPPKTTISFLIVRHSDDNGSFFF
jgi:hypothetical protein